MPISARIVEKHGFIPCVCMSHILYSSNYAKSIHVKFTLMNTIYIASQRFRFYDHGSASQTVQPFGLQEWKFRLDCPELLHWTIGKCRFQSVIAVFQSSSANIFFYSWTAGQLDNWTKQPGNSVSQMLRVSSAVRSYDLTDSHVRT